MDNTHSNKNYAAHGGNEWVIGGKLTFLPGAVVEGVTNLFDVPEPKEGEALTLMPFIPDSDATTVAVLRENYNGLLAALRYAGLMPEKAQAADAEPPDEI